MSQTFFYLNLVDAQTGAINGVISSNSGHSIVVSPTVVPINAGLLLGIPKETIHITHYYRSGRLVAYPPHPGGAVNFDFSIHQWVVDTELAWVQVRAERDQLLSNSDWRVTKALEFGQPLDPVWVTYRQALRDVTGQSDPANIVWPSIPN